MRMLVAHRFRTRGRPAEGGRAAAPARPLAVLAAGVAALGLAACGRGGDEAVKGPVRPVRTTTIAAPATTPAATFAGRIEAKDSVSLAFRIGGRLSERLVGLGAEVKEGQVLARLEPENELNDLRSARAALSAAEGVLRQAEGRYERQAHLHARGVTSQADFEAAEQARKAAASQVEAAAAKVRIAEDVVGFTVLTADAPGVVTAVGAEPGEVVSPGRMVLRLARREGRDAVFDVPAAALDDLALADRVTVQAVGDDGIKAVGRVREVSPEADPVTRLFRIRVGLVDAPRAMALGSAVQGSFAARHADGISLPATALVPGGTEAAVWVVDAATGKVALRPVKVERSDPAVALVSAGLGVGDVVVTAGAGSLKAGQTVRLAGGTP
jgi:RND family efflux transporter MFP subunit